MKPPIRRLTKKEIEWLAVHYCKAHRVDFLQHYNCFLKENPVDAPFRERVGYLDIESTGLKGNWDYMLCYCLKEHGGDILGRHLSQQEITHYKFDKDLTKELIVNVNKFDRVITYYGCLSPGHLVLKSNLKWVDVSNLIPGDELLAFDENPRKGLQKELRYFKTSTVVNNIPIERPCSEIHLENGEVLCATDDHPWLVKRGAWCWRTTKELMHFNGGNEMQSILPVWDRYTDFPYAAGYLAGFFDGEGGIYQSKRKGRRDKTFNIQAAQKDPEVIARVCKCLSKLGFEFSVIKYDPGNANISSIVVRGEKGDKIRFIGESNLVKRKNLDFSVLGKIKQYGSFKIKKIVSVGERTVCGLETTSKTYIANGFGCHNTKFDIPFIKTRAEKWGLDFPSYRDLWATDVYYIAKANLLLHSTRLMHVCDLLGIPSKGHKLDPDIWQKAQSGHIPSLEWIFSHCQEDVVSLELAHERLKKYTLPAKRSL